MTYKELINNYIDELDYLISQKTDPLLLRFFARNYGRKHFKDEDMVETRGYFKGLKVAKECLERHLAMKRHFDRETPQREFEKIIVEDHHGKPYYSVQYKENGQGYVGYSSYDINTVIGFLREYFFTTQDVTED